MQTRIGLVGLGVMGSVHWKAYQNIPDARVVAVCDVRPERLRGQWGGAAGNLEGQSADTTDLSGVQAFASFRRMLANADVDVIDICTPTFLHAPMTIAALKAGRHVFCEKPMALKSAHARRMAAAAKQTGKFLMIGHCLRFWPEYVYIKELIQSARYGSVRAAYFRRASSAPQWSWDDWFRDSSRSGSAALDLHIHDVDLVQWMFGRPAKVSSSGAQAADGGVEAITTLYQFQTGPSITAEGSWAFHAPYPFNMAATIIFEHATVEYNLAANPALTLYHQHTRTKEHPQLAPKDAYAEELRYFVHCVRAGRQPQAITPDQAVNAVELVEAEVRSVKSGRPAAIKPAAR